MCGIAGNYAFTAEGQHAHAYVTHAIQQLAKRGPDLQAVELLNKACLGHARLAILDLSPMGAQPFQDETGRYWIVFNGEIFNFKQLREQLIAKGHTFRSDTDTEVLLCLYIHHREQLFEQLNGFFAFAIYDKLEDTLLLARDRMGIKPLLYYHDKQRFCFASEMKAMMAMHIPKKMDMASVWQYFQLGYIPGPATIFERVHSLPPGYCLTIRKGILQEPEPYYTLPVHTPENYSTDSYEKATAHVRELILDSVQLRLISDVPLGAFLSGGVDSSVVVAAASTFTNTLQTFSIGYKDEPFYDETAFAEKVAQKFNTQHTVFSLTNDDLFEHIFDMLDYIDQPFADSSALAVGILTKHTRKQVTVALSGDGGDEVFAGYHKHAAEFKARNQGWLRPVAQMASPILSALPASRGFAFGNFIRKAQKFASGIQLSPEERYWAWACFNPESEVEQMMSSQQGKMRMELRRQDLFKIFTEQGDFTEFLRADMQLVLPGDMLTKVDLMSMHHSLEVRVPLLDYRLVNYAFSLPVPYKIDAKRKKKILIDAFPELPTEIWQRPKKGFEVPMVKWFQTGLQTTIDSYLDDRFIMQQGLFNPTYIRALKERLKQGNPGDIQFQIWSLLVFQHWYKKYMM